MPVGVRGAVAILAIAIAAAGALPASAQGHDHGPTSARGAFDLDPFGNPNATRYVFFEAAGLVLGPGDTVRYSWSVNNGTGPGVNFTVFTHVGGQHTVLFGATGPRGDGSWQVPSSDPYGAGWANPNPVRVNVSYAFDALPASRDLLILSILGVISVLGIAAVWVFYRAVREGEGKPPAEPPPRP